MATPLTAEQVSWRRRIFWTTWVTYVGFYFCRTPFAATKSEIGEEAKWGATALGDIDAAYLIAYAIGQFLASGMGTWLGPRKNVLIGMTLSIASTVAMGITLDVGVMMGLVAINGLAQATGWSGNVGTMAAWFHKHERGRVMGMWSTNFTVGSLLSGYTMAGVLGLAAAKGGDWRWCFYTGAGVLAIVWIQFYLLQRNRPEDAGLAPIDDPVTPVDESKVPDPPPATGWMGLSRDAWINLWLVGGFYFFVKLVRYAIWGWAAYFLAVHFKMSSSKANVLATAFGVFGLPGVYLTGYLSDKYFGSRRAGVALSMMIGMTIATALLLAVGGTSVVVFTLLLGAVGFTLFGPDALLTGAGAMDIGGRRAATFAAGFISGIGSVGPVVQAIGIGRLYDATKERACGLAEGKLTCWESQDLTTVFVLLFSSAALATLFCLLLYRRNKRGGRGI